MAGGQGWLCCGRRQHQDDRTHSAGDSRHAREDGVMREEHCTRCDGLTGKGGPGDGSLYTSDGEGPYCEECWAKITAMSAHDRIYIEARGGGVADEWFGWDCERQRLTDSEYLLATGPTVTSLRSRIAELEIDKVRLDWLLSFVIIDIEPDYIVRGIRSRSDIDKEIEIEKNR